MSDNYTLRGRDPESGTIRETEITAEQAFDLRAGKPIAYAVRDERLIVTDDGEIIERDSAIPPEPPDAA